MKLLRVIVVVVVAGLRTDARAAETAHAVGALTGYTISSWGPADGLPSSVIKALSQDPSGYLWVGTDVGLVRFDGLRFVSAASLGLAVPEASIAALLTSNDGSLWIGYDGRGGVSRVHGGAVGEFGHSRGLPVGDVTMLTEVGSGTIWACVAGRLFSLNGDRWYPAGTGLGDRLVGAVRADSEGNVWAATDAGVFRQSAGQTDFQPMEPVGGLIRDIAEDSTGRLWLTDPLLGFRVLNERRTHASILDAGRGNRLLHDSRGNVWVGTKGQGLWRLALQGDRAQPLIDRATALIGLSNDGIDDLLEDRDGNIWAATPDGLNRLTPHRVEQVNLGIVNGVAATHDGGVWVGTAGALVRFPNADPGAHAVPQAVASPPLLAMSADDRGGLWFSTSEGLFRIDALGRRSAMPLAGQPVPRQIAAIMSDAKGRVWAYDLARGLLCWSGSHAPVPLPDGLRRLRVNAMAAGRNGEDWFLLADGEVAVLGRDGTVTRFGAADGLTAGVYRVLHQTRDGVVWLGATSGLSRLIDGAFVTLPPSSGLPTAPLTAVLEDDTGDIWLGIQGLGIARIARDQLEQAFASPSHRLRYAMYDRSDGVAGTPQWFGSAGALRARDGRLWFVTGRGATIAEPAALRPASWPNARGAASIDMVAVDGVIVHPASARVLAPNPGRLEISYGQPTLTFPFRTKFRYRLDGYDADWIDAGTRRQASYTNLPPRAYIFNVETSGDDGVWHASPAVWRFAIAPAFYQRTWFPLACVAGLAGIVALAWRLHLRQVRGRFGILIAERARLSREIHDTLLQSMVGIALQCDLVASEVGADASRAREQLIRMRKSVEGYIRETRQSIWDLRSPQLDRDDLADVLRYATAELASAHAVEFVMTVNGTPRPCPPRVDEELLRIGREAVINAVRHSKATRVRMDLAYESERIVLRISDNGRGFDLQGVASEETAGHLGLVSMKERAGRVGGRLDITSAPGAGTTVETVVPARSSQ